MDATHLYLYREDADHGLLDDDQLVVVFWMTVDQTHTA
jgi:hypothetical protein